MVFKRRDRRPVWQIFVDFFYPRGGWSRAAQYVKHRIRRLPDTPEKIARGIWAGVFTTFTPLFGLHFIVAGIIALVVRGNILAALMATFVGNPLTFPAIGYLSLNMGSWILGRPNSGVSNLGQKFVTAGGDLWHNFVAIFTPERMEWRGLRIFFDDVFLPYTVGGLIPGVIFAGCAYYLALPLISAHQKRRKNILRAKLDQLKSKRPADSADG